MQRARVVAAMHPGRVLNVAWETRSAKPLSDGYTHTYIRGGMVLSNEGH